MLVPVTIRKFEDQHTMAIPPTTRRPRAPVERVLAAFSPGWKLAEELDDDGAPVPLATAVPAGAGVVPLLMGYDGVAAVAEATSAKAVAKMAANCIVAVGVVVDVVLSSRGI